MSVSYNDQLPDLANLQTGDSIVFDQKLNWQNPNIQKLIDAGSIAPINLNGRMTGVNVIKPYILPTTQNVPNTNPTDSNPWTPNPNMQSNPYEPLYNQAVSAMNTPVNYNVDPTTDPNYQKQVASNQTGYDLQVNQINTKYGQQIQDTKDAGNRSSGTLARILGQAGGFTTTAGGMAVVSQENQLQTNITRLQTAQQQAIQAAKFAQQTGDQTAFQNAQANLQNIQKDIQSTQTQRAQNMVSLLDKMNNYDQEQQQQQTTTQQNSIKLATEIAPSLNLTGDPKIDNQLIKDTASKYQIDPTFLQAEVEKIKNTNDKNMLAKGYNYVPTPAKVKELQGQGYDIQSVDGRTYAKPQKLTKVTYKGVTTWYNEQGQKVNMPNPSNPATPKNPSNPTTSTPPTPKITKEELAWQKDLAKYRALLAKKGSEAWGEAWNYLHNQYGVDPLVLDQILNKSFYENK